MDEQNSRFEKLTVIIRQYLTEHNLKAADLARKAGKHPSLISNIFTAKHMPSLDNLSALEKAMNLPLGTLKAAAGYIEPEDIGLQSFGEDEHSITIPDLADNELAFYLRQLGSLPEEALDQIKAFLAFQYQQARQQPTVTRPSFARPYPPKSKGGK